MKFSVVIANYNYGHMLARAIDSVLNQTFSDVEVIVVDDGSTDNSKDVIARYGEKVQALFQENSGQSTAYNKGADAALGDYVLFLDADDELLPDAFEIFAEALKKHDGVDYLFAGYISVDEQGNEKVRRATSLPMSRRKSLISYLNKEIVGINNGGGVIKRSVFQEYRYPEGLRNNTDIVFLGQVLANKTVQSVAQPVVKIYAHGARVRRNSKVVLDAGLRSVDALFDPKYIPAEFMDIKALYLTRRLLSLFRVCYKSKSYGLGREYYRRAVKSDLSTMFQWSYTRKFISSLFKKDDMRDADSVLLQVRHSPEGLMDTCNQYLELLPDDKYRKIVVYLKGQHDKAIEDQVPADKVVFLELSGRELRGLPFSAAQKLKRVMRDEAVTDVIAHRYKPIFLSALASFYFVMRSMTAVLHGNGQLRTGSRKLMTWLYLRYKYRFVGVSNQVRSDLLSSHCGLEEKAVFSLPLAIDVEAQDELMLSREAARKALSLDQEQFLIGHIGRLSPSKDQKTLLRAFANVRSEISNARLVVVGEGRCERELRGLAKELGIEASVDFLGKVDGAAKYIKAFDVFAMTSCDEGFGRVLLEAMVAECPVVATDIPSFREVLGEEFDFCCLGDHKLVGEKLRKIYSLTDQERGETGRALRRRVLEMFSKDAVGDRYRCLMNS